MDVVVIKANHRSLYDNAANHMHGLLVSETVGITDDTLRDLMGSFGMPSHLRIVLKNGKYSAAIFGSELTDFIKDLKKQDVPFVLVVHTDEKVFLMLTDYDINLQ